VESSGALLRPPLHRRVLIVEPDRALRAALAAAAGPFAFVDACDSFEAASSRIREASYDLVVTNVRLQAYNGLHLVYLAKLLHSSTPAIVYDEQVDRGLASEVHRACAFYELAHRLPVALPRYIDATLPAEDRRDPSVFDRRKSPRGGRRLWDRRPASM
jgi:DNA-binding NtrC family response regulator